MWAYLYRQLWRMRWLTIAAVALMSGYSIMYDAWIPFLGANIVTILVFFIMWWMNINTMTRLFIYTAQKEKTGANDEHCQKAYTNIGAIGWIMWAMSVVGTYWIVIISYISWFVGPEG